MRIAYDITQTGKDKAGCGYFAYSLIRALAEIDRENEYFLINSFGPYYWDEKASLKSLGIRQAHVREGFCHNNAGDVQYFWRTPQTDLDRILGDCDLLHANNFYCPTGLKKTRLIYTLYDLGFTEHPEWTTTANHSVCFEGVHKASLYADGILSISEYSRDHFLRVFPYYPAENIRVIHLASRYVRDENLKKTSKLPASVVSQQFWLCVGTLEPRKNHLGLLRAYAKYKAKNGKTFSLVHAGGPGWLMSDFKDQVCKLGLQDDVILLGYVDDETLQWLYQNCFAFLYPSFFEGFGLPVLEAMSLGAAVVSSNTTSIPEVAGDAALLVDPADDEALAQAMLRLTDDVLRQEMSVRALTQSERFSWRRTAAETLQLYHDCLC